MGVLMVQRERIQRRPRPEPGFVLRGPQFPSLGMYAPFSHVGDSFAGYQPCVSNAACSTALLTACQAGALCFLVLVAVLR
jgi:hypothetical protein